MSDKVPHQPLRLTAAQPYRRWRVKIAATVSVCLLAYATLSGAEDSPSHKRPHVERVTIRAFLNLTGTFSEPLQPDEGFWNGLLVAGDDPPPTAIEFMLVDVLLRGSPRQSNGVGWTVLVEVLSGKNGKLIQRSESYVSELSETGEYHVPATLRGLYCSRIVVRATLLESRQSAEASIDGHCGE